MKSLFRNVTIRVIAAVAGFFLIFFLLIPVLPKIVGNIMLVAVVALALYWVASYIFENRSEKQ